MLSRLPLPATEHDRSGKTSLSPPAPTGVYLAHSCGLQTYDSPTQCVGLGGLVRPASGFGWDRLPLASEEFTGILCLRPNSTCTSMGFCLEVFLFFSGTGRGRRLVTSSIPMGAPPLVLPLLPLLLSRPRQPNSTSWQSNISHAAGSARAKNDSVLPGLARAPLPLDISRDAAGNAGGKSGSVRPALARLFQKPPPTQSLRPR